MGHSGNWREEYRAYEDTEVQRVAETLLGEKLQEEAEELKARCPCSIPVRPLFDSCSIPVQPLLGPCFIFVLFLFDSRSH